MIHYFGAARCHTALNWDGTHIVAIIFMSAIKFACNERNDYEIRDEILITKGTIYACKFFQKRPNMFAITEDLF